MISLSDYTDGFNGDGLTSEADLIKAMQAGQITGRDTTGQLLTQEPLKVESLETTLKLLEFSMDDIVLFNRLPKLTAYNTVEEFLQLASYGTETGGFYDEGELSEVIDSQYIRKAEKVKYLQVTGEVTIQAQMVKSYVEAYPKEVQNKMMWISRLVNKSLTRADSTVISQEFNSLYKQHASIGIGDDFLYPTKDNYYSQEVVIDLRGKSLTQKNIQDAAVIITNNYGKPTDVFAPTTVMSAYAEHYFSVQRIMQQGNGVTGDFGLVPTSVSTTVGKINLNGDLMMNRDKSKLLSANATHSKAPTAPVADGTTPKALVADVQAKFTTGEQGTVYYAVSAINKFGESPLTLLGASSITITAGSRVDLKFTAGAGANPTSGFRIYRTEVTGLASNVAQFHPLFKIGASQLANGYDGGVAGLVGDRGYVMPNTEEAFITGLSDEVLSFKQLAPMSKLDLAVISMSRRFIVFLFGTPILYTPKKMVRWVNISKTLNP